MAVSGREKVRLGIILGHGFLGAVLASFVGLGIRAQAPAIVGYYDHFPGAALREYISFVNKVDVELNKKTWVLEQEKKLGITYASFPKTAYDYPEGTSFDDFSNSSATYRAETQTIYFLPHRLALIDSLTGLEGLEQKIWGDERANLSMKETFDHESGHHYSSQVMRTLSLKREINPVLDRFKVEKLVSEGIAEYFRRKMNPNNNHPLFGEEKQRNPDRPEACILMHNCTEFYFYHDGFDLVAPVLDEFGVAAGVDFIWRNLPNSEEAMEFDQYHFRARKELPARLLKKDS